MPARATPSPLSALPCAPDQVDEFIAQPLPRVVEAVRSAPGPFLVLGAGGKIGLHLSLMLRRALEAAGRKDRVVAVSRFRTLRDSADFTSRGVETLACDLADPAALARLPDAPTIFFLAGVKFGTADDPKRLHAVNIELPSHVAERFRTSRIVAFSSGCIYPFVTPASGGATERTPPAPVGDYAVSCLAREEAFSAAARKHGNPVALIRLNYAVEFRYGLLVDIAERVMRREPVDVTMGHVNVIWQGDAVAHTIQSLALAGSPAVPLNVTGPDTLAVRDVAERFGKLFGLPVKLAGTEAGTALLNNAAYSHRVLGAPAVSVESMMDWIVAWLRGGGSTWGKPTGFERRDGRY